MVGVVIYAGILDKVVGAHLHGHPDLSLKEIWHVLPLNRLVGADVVLAIGTMAGWRCSSSRESSCSRCGHWSDP